MQFNYELWHVFLGRRSTIAMVYFNCIFTAFHFFSVLQLLLFLTDDIFSTFQMSFFSPAVKLNYHSFYTQQQKHGGICFHSAFAH